MSLLPFCFKGHTTFSMANRYGDQRLPFPLVSILYTAGGCYGTKPLLFSLLGLQFLSCSLLTSSFLLIFHEMWCPNPCGLSARVHFCAHIFVPSSNKLLHLFQFQCKLQSTPPYCQPTLLKTFQNPLFPLLFFIIFITSDYIGCHIQNEK